MDSKSLIDVSIVMPAYNEEGTINEVITRVDRVFEKTGFTYELIVVDDGSLDRTRGIALACSQYNGNLKVIGYDINIGKGHAIKLGFSQARGEFIVFLDSDFDIAPNQINEYIRALKHGDVVIGSKLHPHSIVKVPLLRSFLSRGFNILVKLLTGLRVHDTQTGLKAIRRTKLVPMLNALTIRRFAFDVELLTIANLSKLKIIELPVKLELTNAIFNPVEVWKMFVDLLGISYRMYITKWYQKKLFSAKY